MEQKRTGLSYVFTLAKEERGKLSLGMLLAVFSSALSFVLMLQKKNGMVRSVDLARHMEVSKPSVSRAVAILQEGGFLTVDSDYFLHLTEADREVAEKIYERHQFFTEQLVAAGVDQETAEQEACRMEHAISDTAFQKLKEKIQGTD